jgi:hypothetical protein
MKQRYYSAIALREKPFVSFGGIGSFTAEEFEASAYADDPLVVAQSELPGYSFGVCNAKIVAGELVNRTPAEMAVFEAEYTKEVSLKSERRKIDTINDGFFTFDGNDFPMDEVSRLYYLSIDKKQPATSQIKTMQNVKYQLDAVDIDDFMSEYYAKLLLLSKHTL